MADVMAAIPGTGPMGSVSHSVATQNTRRVEGRVSCHSQTTNNKRKIRAENVLPVNQLKIVDLYIEGLTTRNRHDMELSKYVQRRLNTAGYDEVLIDDVIGIVLAEHRTRLAFILNGLKVLPEQAKEAAKDSAKVIA